MIKSYYSTNISIEEYTKYKECKYKINYDFSISHNKIKLQHYNILCSKPLYNYGKLNKSYYDEVLFLGLGNDWNELYQNNLSKYFQDKTNWPDFVKYKKLSEVKISTAVIQKLKTKIQEAKKNLIKVENIDFTRFI